MDQLVIAVFRTVKIADYGGIAIFNFYFQDFPLSFNIHINNLIIINIIHNNNLIIFLVIDMRRKNKKIPIFVMTANFNILTSNTRKIFASKWQFQLIDILRCIAYHQSNHNKKKVLKRYDKLFLLKVVCHSKRFIICQECILMTFKHIFFCMI